MVSDETQKRLMADRENVFGRIRMIKKPIGRIFYNSYQIQHMCQELSNANPTFSRFC